jgi:hypothetical protein
LRRVVWWKFTDASEVRAASIINEMSIRTIITLMMKAVSTSETLVNFYQTTRYYNPEDSSHLHIYTSFVFLP